MSAVDFVRIVIGMAGAWTIWFMGQLCIVYYKICHLGHPGVRPRAVLLDRAGYILLVGYIIYDITLRIGEPITWRTPVAAFSIGFGLPGIMTLVWDLEWRLRKLQKEQP